MHAYKFYGEDGLQKSTSVSAANEPDSDSQHQFHDKNGNILPFVDVSKLRGMQWASKKKRIVPEEKFLGRPLLRGAIDRSVRWL